MSKGSAIIDFFTGIPTYIKSLKASNQAAKTANAANDAATAYTNKSQRGLQKLYDSSKGPKHYQDFLNDLDKALDEFDRTKSYTDLYAFLTKGIPGDNAAKLAALNKWLGTNYKNIGEFMVDPATRTRRNTAYFRNLIRPQAERDLKNSQNWYNKSTDRVKRQQDKLNADYQNAQAAADQARVLQNRAGQRALVRSGVTTLGTGAVGGGGAIAVNSAMDTPNEYIVDNSETSSIPVSTPTSEQTLTVPKESTKEDPAWYTKWLETNAPEWYKTFQNTLANPVMPPSTQTSTGSGTPVKDSTFMDKLLNFGFPLLTGSIKGGLNGINDLLINAGLGMGELTKSFWDSFNDSNTTPLSTSTTATPQSTPVITEEPKESIVQSQETPVKEPVVETPPVVSSSKPAPSAPPVKQSVNVPQTVVNTPTEADVASAMVKKAVTPQVLQYGSPYYGQTNKPVNMRQWVRQKYGMSQSPAELVQRGIMPYEYLQYW